MPSGGVVWPGGHHVPAEGPRELTACAELLHPAVAGVGDQDVAGVGRAGRRHRQARADAHVDPKFLPVVSKCPERPRFGAAFPRLADVGVGFDADLEAGAGVVWARGDHVLAEGADEVAFGVELLDAAVAGVDRVEVAGGLIDRQAGGFGELPAEDARFPGPAVVGFGRHRRVADLAARATAEVDVLAPGRDEPFFGFEPPFSGSAML